jgi:hypothetical protein
VVAQSLKAKHIRVLELGLRRATLEDVFLTLTRKASVTGAGDETATLPGPAHRWERTTELDQDGAHA